MCGRFALYTPLGPVVARYFGLTDAPQGEPRYNVAPGTAIHILQTDAQGSPRLDPCHWGFRPPGAGVDAPRPINARAEKVATSPYFCGAFARHRCLIPADGWYEWRQTPQGRQPYYITLRDPGEAEVIFLAGIHAPGTGVEDGGCAVITEPARGPLATIHPRQPLALNPTCLQAWLDPDITERQTLRARIRPLDPARLEIRPVDLRVNRAGEEGPELIRERQRGLPAS
ncbi:Putative SOS response-associated peptidase YedK [Ectothiorhodospira mobilis]|uniref:Abasic site processing protein n=1 Tax=Ectothiorhodospira mobilis TaxID=195064 RepID=A0A1I4PP42_ECTMO|nr:SOS response-associated peptidase [Ectothiorhodospira mobilis]SFM29233.1 Putative SOS response-associated peptidase YedK [Ectothiorhodospira mobilis]